MYPPKFVVPRGTFSVSKGLKPTVALVDGEKPRAWIKQKENEAEEALKSDSVSGKGPALSILWFWKVVRHFTTVLQKSKKPVCISDTRKKLSEGSHYFNHHAFDTAIRYLFNL
jgi:hypothetical protein